MTEITEDLHRYVTDLFAPEDDALAELGRRTAASEEAPMQVNAEVGQLLHVLARAVGAKRILEVGTLFGYSTIWLARALAPGGRLVTLEADAGRAAEAREWIRRAGAGDIVEIRVGPALDTLPKLSGPEPFDLAFLDAAKQEYPAYLDWALRLVRRGGIVAADNTLIAGSSVHEDRPDQPGVQAIREFNRRIATDPRLASTILPVREGVSVSVVL